MDRKSKILLVVLLMLILASAALTYYRTMYTKDFLIHTEGEEGIEE